MSQQVASEHGSGQVLRDRVAEVIEGRDYLLVPQVRFRAAQELEQPIYSRHFEGGQDLYGKPRRVDFVLYHPSLHGDRLAIQCRWQAVSGSVEEKFPFEVQSVRRAGLNTVIVLDGGGYTERAKNWLSSQVSTSGLIAVLDLSEFTRYAESGGI